MATQKQRLEQQNQMYSLIESWQESGKTQREFCKNYNLAYTAFHYWYKKYRLSQQPTTPSAFIPLQIPPNIKNPIAEITFPDGRRFTFYSGMNLSFLERLLS